jgi:Lar family restriction alleviation protein
MKFKLLHDFDVHKAGEIIEFDKSSDKRYGDDTIGWCFGHGCYFTLKIGTDIEIIKDNLKKCPFCGKDAYLRHRNQLATISSPQFQVFCETGCVSMPSRLDMWFDSEASAIEHWNQRSQQS